MTTTTKVRYPATGAINRTVGAKAHDTISVKDFGAVGDGVTDDTVSLQAAFNAASGKTLLVTSGTYVISSTLSIRSNTTLAGEGAGRSVIALAASLPAGSNGILNESFSGTPNTYADQAIRIDGLTFDGKSTPTRTASFLGFNRVKGLRITNCEFINHTYITVVIAGCKDVDIDHNRFLSNGRPKPSAVSTPCIWTDTTASGTPYYVRIEHNYFEANNWSCAYFMPFNGSFSFNTCLNNGESAVFSQATGYNLRYIGNHIEGQTRSNISASGIETGAQNIIIADNTIVSNASDGISLTDVQNATVHDNIIMQNGQEPTYFPTAGGISIITNIAPYPDHIRIHSNRIGDRQSVKTQWSGINVTGTGSPVTRVAIHDNDLTEQKTNTIFISAGKWGSGCYSKENYDRNALLMPPVKVVQFQVPASVGNFAVTGIGFRPRAIEIVATEAGTNAYQSVGVYDGTSQLSTYLSVDAAGRRGSPGGAVMIATKDSAAVARATATMVSTDVDGFTLNFSTVVGQPWCIAKCYA